MEIIEQAPELSAAEKKDKVEQKGLFDFLKNPSTTVNKSGGHGLTCNSCEHRQSWQCGSKVFQYCGVRKSNRTINGLQKIKCKTAACPIYKPFKP
jgi:hypothetical protein